MCSTCTAPSSSAPLYPTHQANGTVATSTGVAATGGYTTSKATSSSTSPAAASSTVPATAGAGKVAALSGAALAGAAGLFAVLL